MKHIFKPLITLFFLTGIVLAQFRMDVPKQSLPTNLNGELDEQSSLSLFDPARFNMSHGFTMSMMNIGGQSVSQAGFSNQITYMAMDNLRLDANVTLYKTQLPFQQQGALLNQFDVAYDAAIIYQPTKNSFLEFRIQNYPHYQNYQSQSPFNSRLIK
ncbi:MAG: hypothetical protein HOB40_07355 [Candidatus Marinimicrobia bacterium]|jgi:hypothetical protein|nr:hypothetical protein [Candidatus Neomarinimicrobiota bacterium]MBT3500701.1 hypothetical protein [Candidatus Neomarinimicrobiota bacterium]MBT3839549.1 hypothetical protein [Candidatus Neomarinimicrobiota bacterium]MBT3998921.1 hypothetical protein [Candidatus Neomarinimicrobiota bacterium]MBT4282872.1 hypothetical protein [Candidatus Neomarinimicrobiota bacterium]